MADIRPFRGLRFTPAAGAPADLVAPPYDVLSQEQRDELAEKNPHNIVHLTLPEQLPDDRSKFVKYARSAARLESWRRDNALALEERPAFYRYTQTFSVPGKGQLSRTTLIALLKIEPYDKGVVLPHEQTFPKHKEDRLRILEATRSHLECIFGLYEDPDQAIHHLVSSAPAGQKVELTTADDAIVQCLEVVDEPDACAAVSAALADKRLWIADGHHRYETALSFRQSLGDKPGIVPEDFMMMAVCSMTDPGLVLLPTHRILNQMPVAPERLRELLEQDFTVTDAPNTGLMSLVEAAGTGSFGVALPGGNGFVATAKDARALAANLGCKGSQGLKELDVTLLHEHIFGKLLNLHGLEFFGYTRMENEAVFSVENGAPAAFLMNPPTVDDMRRIALGGEKMPQKSTYYYPKLLSGLVVWSLKDF